MDQDSLLLGKQRSLHFLVGIEAEAHGMQVMQLTCMTSGGKEGSLDARMWGSRRSSRAGCCPQAK